MNVEIRTLAETGSTNADMLALAATGVPEGLWLRAERQTGGRGRMGRAWESPEGNLHASTIVRLRPGDPPAPTLALVAAVAAQEAVQRHIPNRIVTIKWPNDLLVGEAKLCGMLLERGGDAVVIGIGVNVTGAPKGLDRPVTSLWQLGAVDSDAPGLLSDIAQAFALWLDRWRTDGLAAVREQWIAAAHPEGSALRAALPDGEVVTGQFATLDMSGALVMRLPDGRHRTIHAGDVFLI